MASGSEHDELSRTAPWASPALVPILAAGLRAARGDWPQVTVPLADYLEHVRARWAATDPAILSAQLARDLYLACACSTGQPEAAKAFDRDVLASAVPAVQHIDRDADFIDETLQRARERLLVGPADGRPRIADYTGLGSLRGWVRVVVVRLALQALRARGRPMPEVDDEDDAVRPEERGSDPERDHLQARYGGWFRRSIKEALGALGGDERRLLELLVRERLSLAEIGVRLGLDKSTISRRMATLRARVFDEIQRRARAELKVAGGEYESLLRLVHSQLDVSLDFADET